MISFEMTFKCQQCKQNKEKKNNKKKKNKTNEKQITKMSYECVCIFNESTLAVCFTLYQRQ